MSRSDPARLDVSAITRSLDVPESFPPDVLDAAQAVARRPARKAPDGGTRVDLTHVPFVTIDPEGSRDLDQAFHAEAGDGFTVRYAIADVAHFVDPGGAIEAEAWRRGLTLYTPDGPVPLYPPVLGSGAASLLPNGERPAIVFTLALDAEGRDRLVSVQRAVVRSRAQLSYHSVGRHLAALRAGSVGELAGNEWSAALELLGEIGARRQHLEAERGAVSLPVREQHVERWAAALAGYRLVLRSPNDVEGWNAQISLMTGMAAARLMLERGIGFLRVLAPPREERLRALRLTAGALGVSWPEGGSFAGFVRSLDPTHPVHTAILFHAVGVSGGAFYRAFEGCPGEELRHSAIAGPYAHVTAPLRRLADRYTLDLVVELAAGRKPSAGTMERLQALEGVMEAADRRARSLEAAIVDTAEAVLLVERDGETFDATVVRIRPRGVTIQLADPPVRAEVPLRAFARADAPEPGVAEDGSALEAADRRVALGDRLLVRLVAADTRAGRVAFEPISA